MRWPWKRHRLGLLVAGAGLLALAAGATQSIIRGTEGQVSLKEGECCNQFVATSRSVITATHLADGHQVATDFTFAPGPTDWPDRKRLDFGQDGGLGLKIVKFIRHAQQQVDWVADASDYEGPALELRLCGPGGGWVDEDWLAASLFGGEAVIGPTMYQLWPLPVATMVEDFLNPPSGSANRLGTLSIHHEGRMYRVPVEGNIGQRVPLGKTQIEVELVECFADARPKLEGGFFSRSDQPRNPLLELKIYFPDRAEPVRQVAFAKSPLVNLDGVHRSICPVRFWYHHPQSQRTPGAVFAQAPDGKLWCRPIVEGEYRDAQPVQAGSQVPIGGRFRILVLNHIPQARREVSFTASDTDTVKDLDEQDDAGAESAVLVEVTYGGVRREVWLQREDPRLGTQTMTTEAGPLMLSFGYQRLPLGFELQLDDLIHESDPGRANGTTRLVRIIDDPATQRAQKCEISMNRPLIHGKFTMMLTNQQQLVHGAETTILKAIYDPGRPLKHWGVLTICVGLVSMVAMRAWNFRKRLSSIAGSWLAGSAKSPNRVARWHR